jgi:hypothetical protein
MVERSAVLAQQAGMTSSVSRKSASRTEALPLEVVVLLDVFARIEARRQARLQNAGKEGN